MQLVLGWPIRVLLIALVVFSLFVDGAGYVYRGVNHLPLSGKVDPSTMPPNFSWWPFNNGSIYIHQGLDLQGGSHLELQLTDIPPGRSKADVQATAVQVFQKRLNSLGVNEPLVQPEGQDRVVVELAGVSAARAQEVIGKTAHLDFVTWTPDAKATAVGQAPAGYKPKLTGLGSAQVVSATSGLDQNGLQYAVNLTFNADGASQFSKLTTDAVAQCPGDGVTCPTRSIAIFEDLTAADIANWSRIDPSTGQAAESPVALPPSQGGKLLTNPNILQPIAGGTATITGNFDATSARDLAVQISSGALPANVKVLSSTDVGASLGADSVKRSIAAGLVGLAIVVIFMISYYRLPGLLASLALIVYAGIVLAIFKTVPVTMTLAGLAGFILSVGMAVDANVLIFERFKEEMRAGRTIGAAVDAAVRRAWPAIRDSNTSTAITCFVLLFAAPTQIQGFALTLLIGVAISLISSIIVTHNLLAIVLNFGGGFRNPRLLGVTRAA
ncbi:MAG: protein translocase subunit SecD [Candidatus Dormibacteraeota bacterium]|nr:protein translocase subunit SecD [Candidatus Dormibacteraeota bacterium]